MSRATEVAQRITKAFDDHDVDAFAGCFTADAVQHHPFFPAPLQGREAILAAEATLFGSFDDVGLEATNVVDAGEWMGAEFRVTARHTRPLPLPDGTTLSATGRTIDLVMAAFMRLDADGQIVEAHRYQDNLAFLRALGVAG